MRIHNSTNLCTNPDKNTVEAEGWAARSIRSSNCKCNRCRKRKCCSKRDLILVSRPMRRKTGCLNEPGQILGPTIFFGIAFQEAAVVSVHVSTILLVSVSRPMCASVLPSFRCRTVRRSPGRSFLNRPRHRQRLHCSTKEPIHRLGRPPATLQQLLTVVS